MQDEDGVKPRCLGTVGAIRDKAVEQSRRARAVGTLCNPKPKTSLCIYSDPIGNRLFGHQVNLFDSPSQLGGSLPLFGHWQFGTAPSSPERFAAERFAEPSFAAEPRENELIRDELTAGAHFAECVLRCQLAPKTTERKGKHHVVPKH